MNLDTRARQSTLIRFAAMPMGRWRIAWLGDIAFHAPARTQPTITVVLENLDPAGAGRLTDVVIPIGQLWALKGGSVWVDKVLSDDINASSATRRISFKTWQTALRAAGVSVAEGNRENFLLPFGAHPFHRDHTKAWCLTVEVDGQIVIFPAVELIRFYFGSSGTLLRKLFSANFEPRSIAHEFQMSERRKAAVTLAGDMPAASAKDVARIVLDEHAGAAARMISRGLVAARAGSALGEKIYAKTVFPFVGDADVTVRGIDIAGADGTPRFLVQEMLQCRARFPFAALEYVCASRERRASAAGGSDAETHGADKALLRGSARVMAGRVENREPRAAASSRAIGAGAVSRFPDLDAKPVWRGSVDLPPRVALSALPAAPYDSTGRGEPSAVGKRVELNLDDNNRRRTSTLRSPCENWVPYFDLLAALDRAPWVQALHFVRLDPRQTPAHYVRLPEIVDDNSGVVDVFRTVCNGMVTRNPRWASFANVWVGGVASAVISVSPPPMSSTVLVRVRRGFALESDFALRALVDAWSQSADHVGWSKFSLREEGNDPRDEVATTPSTASVALGEFERLLLSNALERSVGRPCVT